MDLYIKTFFCFLDSIHLLMYTSMPNASVILYRKILCSTIKHITPRSLTKLENVRALNSNIPTVRIATPDKVKNLQLMIWFNIHDNYWAYHSWLSLQNKTQVWFSGLQTISRVDRWWKYPSSWKNIVGRLCKQRRYVP